MKSNEIIVFQQPFTKNNNVFFFRLFWTFGYYAEKSARYKAIPVYSYTAEYWNKKTVIIWSC